MREEADVIIVGAGSSGCVLANRLSADPARRVVLIEAGHRITDPEVRRPESWPFIQGRDYDWAYSTTAQPGLADRVMPWPRGRGLGGSSNLHAMAHMRGEASDFARWAVETRNPRWSWEGLLPFFRATEHFVGGTDDSHPELHGTTGPLPVLIPGPDLVNPLVRDYLTAWEAEGLARIDDHNHGSMIGATPNALTIAGGERVTAADAYLLPVLGRANLEVLTDVLVHRVLLEDGVARGVEVGHDAGTSGRRTIRGNTVILAAGSIGDPLLLMRSGVGDPAALAAAGVSVTQALPGVGRNLHDHLLGAGNLYRSRRPIPASRLQLSESMTYLPVEGPGGAGEPEVVVGCVVGASVSEAFHSSMAHVEEHEAYTFLFGVTHPTSRGAVRITGPDPDDPPFIDPAYLSTDHDRSLFRRALDLARLVGASPALHEWRAEEVLPGVPLGDDASADAFIARAAITHHHPVGTCRMGLDEEAVVDEQLRVRGVDCLYVVDAAVFPAITTGPIHAPVLAVAESFAASFPS
jgi:pyridoxine 4-oxidase